MKAIAIIEIPDGDKGKWYIDGYIRYTEDESTMKRFDKEMIPLKPMPQKGDFEIADDHPFSKAEIMAYTYGITVGRNQVIEEITE